MDWLQVTVSYTPHPILHPHTPPVPSNPVCFYLVAVGKRTAAKKGHGSFPLRQETRPGQASSPPLNPRLRFNNINVSFCFLGIVIYCIYVSLCDFQFTSFGCFHRFPDAFSYCFLVQHSSHSKVVRGRLPMENSFAAFKPFSHVFFVTPW